MAGRSGSKEAGVKTVLIIEDTEDFAENLRFLLTKAGYHVVVGCDGRDGLEKAMRVKPDLILMDLLMPQLDGVQATALIREREELKDVPVVFLTAVTAGENVVVSVNGADYPAISKMTDHPVLLEKVRHYVRTTDEKF